METTGSTAGCWVSAGISCWLLPCWLPVHHHLLFFFLLLLLLVLIVIHTRRPGPTLHRAPTIRHITNPRRPARRNRFTPKSTSSSIPRVLRGLWHIPDITARQSGVRLLATGRQDTRAQGVVHGADVIQNIDSLQSRSSFPESRRGHFGPWTVYSLMSFVELGTLSERICQ